MEVALDGAHGAAQGLCQGLHLGPAEARLVVGVIGEGAVGGDRLGGGSSEDEGLDFRDTGKSGLLSHRRLLYLVRRCALMIEFTKAAGPRQKEIAPPLFLCSFCWCVLYLHSHPRASPRTIGTGIPCTHRSRDLDWYWYPERGWWYENGGYL